MSLTNVPTADTKPPFVATPTNFLVLRFEARQLLVARPSSYDDLQREIRRHFPDIPANHRVSYHTDEMAISNGALVELSPDLWDALIPQLSALTVQSAPEFTFTDDFVLPVEAAHRCSSLSLFYRPIDFTKFGEPKMDLKLRLLPSGDVFNFTCPSSMPVGDIISRCLPEMDIDAGRRHEYLFNNSPITREMLTSLEEFGLKDGDQIDVRPQRGMAKPVIYLFPPAGSEIDASTAASEAQRLRWEVRAAPDGLMLEKQTGLEVAYLYWEAEPVAPVSIASSSTAQPVPSAPGGLMEDNSLDTKFDPSEARLEPGNSVVLNVENITPYLDSALKALGLHTEARTSFITYWLPSFLRHKFVVLRFLPQSQYEHAAPLDVVPKPDVTLRVFMLFKGLQADEVSDDGWSMADPDNVKQWGSVVGIHEELSLPADTSLFRVVEWGGMELY